MGLFNHFPYTNFHELNLAWVIEVCKAAEKASGEAKLTAEQALQYFQNLNLSDEIHEAIGELYNSGVLMNIIDAYISGTAQNYNELSGEIDVLKKRLAALLEDSPSDGEIIDIRTGYNGEQYDDAGDAVRGQVSDLWTGVAGGFASVLSRISPKLGGASRGHLYEIAFDNTNDVIWLTKENNAYIPYKTLKGSPIMEAPPRLCFAFDSGAKIVLNFFRKIDGAMVQVHDVFEYITGTGRVNWVGAGNVPGLVIDCPAGTFFNVAIYEGNCHLYGWDAEPFGPPVSATMDYLNTDGTLSVMRTGGGCLLTIPGNAMAVCVDGGAIRTIGRVKDGVVQDGASGITARFSLLPGDADFYIVTYLPGYDFAAGTYDKTTIDGVVEGVHIAADCDIMSGYGAAHKVLENCRRVASTRWTPAADIKGSGTARTFKVGVTYSGLPYCSTWSRPGLVGWHISLRTFLAAVADPNSIFYKERVDAEDDAPPYGINCSAFTTMCQGWPVPATNQGMFTTTGKRINYNPQLLPGNIYTNGSHCFICGEVTRFNDGVTSVETFEAVTPILGAMVRYSNIPETDLYAYNHTRGMVYFNRYFVSPFSAGTEIVNSDYLPQIVGDMSNTYFDTNNGPLTAGSARPYKGNYCVFTDEETKYDIETNTAQETGIFINVHRSDATEIWLYNEGGAKIATIPVDNAESVDIAPYLNITGLYSVCTDVDNVKEHFEYVKKQDTRPYLAGQDYSPIYAMRNDKMEYGTLEDYYTYDAVAFRGRYGVAMFYNFR